VILIEPTAARVRFPRALAAARAVRSETLVFGDGRSAWQSRSLLGRGSAFYSLSIDATAPASYGLPVSRSNSGSLAASVLRN
jgi:hypothetical protein